MCICAAYGVSADLLLRGNQLTGTISDNLGKASLSLLDLGNNSFRGNISFLSASSLLTQCLLDHNLFDGPVLLPGTETLQVCSKNGSAIHPSSAGQADIDCAVKQLAASKLPTPVNVHACMSSTFHTSPGALSLHVPFGSYAAIEMAHTC